MSFKTKDGKTHQSSVLISENGLPVDSIATISGSYVFLEGLLPLVSYSGGVVTLPAGYDLDPVTVAKARYTGKYILLTKDHKIYYIDRVSIDVSAGTFLVSTSDKNQVNPLTIDLSAGWTIAEADIVNRLATTSSAKIDSIEFRDMQFNLTLDGDPVTIIDKDGDELDINPDGSINARVQGLVVGLPQTINMDLPTLGTEYVVNLPITVRRFQIKARGLAKLNLAYTALSTQPITISPGCTYEEANLVTPSALRLYIKSNKPNTVIEAVYWE